MSDSKVSPEGQGGEVTSVPAVKFNELEQKFHTVTAELEDFRKRFNGIDLDDLKSKAKERDQLAAKLVNHEPERFETELKRAREEAEANTRKTFGEKLTETEKARDTALEELRTLKIVNPATSKAKEYFNEDQIELLLPHIKQDFGLGEKGELIVVDKEGKPVLSKKDPRTGAMTADEYFEGLAEKYPSSAKARVQSGGRKEGTVITNANTGELTTEKFLAMTEAQRAALPADVRTKMAAQVFKSSRRT